MKTVTKLIGASAIVSSFGVSMAAMGQVFLPPAQTIPSPTPSPSPSPKPGLAQIGEFTIENGKFAYGDTFSGRFTYDFNNEIYTSYSFTTRQTNPESLFTSATYNNDNSTIDYYDTLNLYLKNGTSALSFAFLQPVSPDATSIDLDTDYSAESRDDGELSRRIVGGQFNAVQGAAPEPGSWALMILGFGIVGYAMRRRRVTFGNRVACTV